MSDWNFKLFIKNTISIFFYIKDIMADNGKVMKKKYTNICLKEKKQQQASESSTH